MDVARFEADADLMLDWDDVVEVELAVAAGSQMQCPISLDSPPICPQITVRTSITRPGVRIPYEQYLMISNFNDLADHRPPR